MNWCEITSSIGRDLAIFKYSGESENEYISRLTYSSLGVWARFLAAYSDDSGKTVGNIHKATHHRRLSENLQRFILIYDFLEEFYADDDAVAKIRNPLFASEDMLELGFDSRLSIGVHQNLAVDSDCTLILASEHIPPAAFASGLAIAVARGLPSSDKDILEHWNIPNYSSSVIWDNAIKTAKWEAFHVSKECEFFDPRKQGTLSACWVQLLHLSSDPCIARKKPANGQFEYYLVKQVDTTVFASKFSEFAQNEFVRETQRLLYALKAKANNRSIANVDVYRHYSVWHFWSKLPPQEEKLLRYIGWPKNGITNRTNEFVVRNEFNNLLSLIADNLGVIRKEIRHE